MSNTLWTLAGVIALHLGKLHPFEKLLVFLIAFGPFVVLGLVVYFVRKRDIAEEEEAERLAAEQSQQQPPD